MLMVKESYKSFYVDHFCHHLQDPDLLELATHYPIQLVYKKVLEQIAPNNGPAMNQALESKFAEWEASLPSLWSAWQDGTSQEPVVEHYNLTMLHVFLEHNFIVEPELVTLEQALQETTCSCN